MSILLVDDDAVVRIDLAELLQMKGWEVDTAKNGREALARLREGGKPPCLILLDLMMPVMNGWDFRAAQLDDPALESVPVLVLSGAADVQREAGKLKAAGYLTKPVEIDELFDMVKEFCH